MDIDMAMQHPGAIFGTPEVLDATAELSVAQKHAILVQWKDQLRQLLTADEENMARAGADIGTNADILRRVTDILTRLSVA